MKFNLVCVGKIKEKYIVEGINEYLKRMKRFGGLEIIEVSDEPIPAKSNEKINQEIKKREGERILEHIDNDDWVISLEINGKLLTSENLAAMVEEHFLYSSSGRCTFVIGGSLGSSQAVINRADIHLSFGRMTLPHQLMRLVLAEQIYRLNMINAHSIYHK